MEFRKPGPVYSALVGKAARARLPVPLRGPAYRAFARAVGADLGEAELDLRAYVTLGDLFARRLRPGARTLDTDPRAIPSPCDGVVAAVGTADHGAMIQAKGLDYQLEDLVVDRELAERLTGGAYATIYLSPRDYHRVHTPVDARIVHYDYVPGALWPVNPRVASRRERLLVRNERVVIALDAGALGTVAVVMVGASGVGNIALTYAPESVTWRGNTIHAFPQVPESVLFILDMDALEIVVGRYTKPTWMSDIGGGGKAGHWTPGTTHFEDTVMYALGLAARRRNTMAGAVALKQ